MSTLEQERGRPGGEDGPAVPVDRVSKHEMIRRVARRSGATQSVTAQVYRALVAEIVDSVSAGDDVVLTGFGKFYLQQHRGHKVRFGRPDVADYPVLKFSASSAMNRRFVEHDLRKAG